MKSLERVKIPVGDPVYNEVLDLLYTEAELLDEGRLEEWLDLLGEEVSYRMPIRVTLERSEGPGFSPSTTFFDDNRMLLSMRVQRIVSSPNAHAEMPPTRSRRFVTNLRVELEGDDIIARTSLLLLRSRWDMKSFEFLSARRDDVLRRVGDDLKIVRREILIDQAVLDSPNLSVFL
jgi:3-phenylpropionate/cinnamic acid dioxygenase small subunit